MEIILKQDVDNLGYADEIVKVRPGYARNYLIPRGMAFRVALPDGAARGYVCENYGALFRLPERGPVGSDGYANDRDFLAPAAWFEDSPGPFEIITRFGGACWRRDDRPS